MHKSNAGAVAAIDAPTARILMRGLIWVIAATALLLAAGCGTQTVKVIIVTASPTADPVAQEMAVKEGVHSIEIGVQSYAIDNAYENYPKASLVNASDLADYVDNWPTNPYTGQPMTQGTGPGDFSYSTTGASFEIDGFGKGGEVVVVVP